MTIQFLVRYGEIALKGKNRNLFEQKLQHNIKDALKDFPTKITRMHGRFMITGSFEDHDMIVLQLSRVFGIESFSRVYETDLDVDLIQTVAAKLVDEYSTKKETFKIETRRANKSFPYTSPDLNRILGSHLQSIYPGLQVNLNQPAFRLFVEISFKKAYLYLDKKSGPGGLPLGTTGRSMLLLSGGIDSPVAGWLAMKRGLDIEALHFHSFPFTSHRSLEKTTDLCRKLAQYSNKIILHTVNLSGIQKELYQKCPDEMGIILLRRMMFRIASMLCEKRNIKTLITGENLGQVASQTLESISVIDTATDQLVLRPLLCLDKKEIINLAVAIGTYDISIRPYEDCCTLFVPRKPVTKPREDIILKHEKILDIDLLINEAVKTLETQTITG